MKFLEMLAKFSSYLGALRENPKASNVFGGFYALVVAAAGFAFVDQQGWIDAGRVFVCETLCAMSNEQLLNVLFGCFAGGVAFDTLVTHAVVKEKRCEPPQDGGDYDISKNAGSKTGRS